MTLHSHGLLLFLVCLSLSLCVCVCVCVCARAIKINYPPAFLMGCLNYICMLNNTDTSEANVELFHFSDHDAVCVTFKWATFFKGEGEGKAQQEKFTSITRKGTHREFAY